MMELTQHQRDRAHRLVQDVAGRYGIRIAGAVKSRKRFSFSGQCSLASLSPDAFNEILSAQEALSYPVDEDANFDFRLKCALLMIEDNVCGRYKTYLQEVRDGLEDLGFLTLDYQISKPDVGPPELIPRFLKQNIADVHPSLLELDVSSQLIPVVDDAATRHWLFGRLTCISGHPFMTALWHRATRQPL